MRTAFLLALIMAVPIPALADELRVGAGSVDITPPVGTPMAGYYAERLSKGVHDPLFAKAIVLERGGKKAALVALDLIAERPHEGYRPDSCENML
jgi:neutral ceramidase